MAKVIKLKDRQGNIALPLTRSQLVQVSAITGLDLLGEKTFTSASVQDALEALMSYATTIKESNATALKDIDLIKDALKDVLDTQRAVANYVDNAKDLAYAKAISEAAAAQANAYIEAASKSAAAEKAAKDYADGKFLSKVKLNDAFVNVEIDETNGRYVDLGSIATSDSLQTLTDKVNAIELAYITKAASEEADNSIIRSYTAADSAIVSSYTAADSAIIASYTAADEAIINAYKAADEALSGRIDNLQTDLERDLDVTLDETANPGDGILKVYTIKQGGTPIGTINIPKDLVATSGSLVYCTKSESTYTEVDSSIKGAIACIKMIIQNGNPFYIEVADLIEYNSVKSNAEITLTDTGHVIEATVGAISSNKITFTPSGDNPADTTVQAALRDLYTQIGEGGSVASQIQTAIQELDADIDASGTPAHNGTFVVSGVTEVDGKITSVDSVEVEAAGAAAAVKTALLGGADTNNDTLGKLAGRINTLDGAAVKSVNGQSPNGNGAVTINANQIDTVTTFKIGSDDSAKAHKVDEVLTASVFYEQFGVKEVDDVNLTF